MLLLATRGGGTGQEGRGLWRDQATKLSARYLLRRVGECAMTIANGFVSSINQAW